MHQLETQGFTYLKNKRECV